MKLSYKIFSVYLFVSFVLFLLMMATLRFYMLQHFDEVEKQVENELVTILSYEFALEFQRENSWDRFRDAPETYSAFIRAALVNRNGFQEFVAPYRGASPPAPPGGPPPLAFARSGRPGISDPGMQDPGAPIIGTPMGPGGGGGARSDFLRPHERISLYDANKICVAGCSAPDTELVFKPIMIHERRVGWIGICPQNPPPDPLQAPFLQEKLQVFYTIGIIIFILAGIVSYILSRQILSPVRKLTLGTKALTQFKFDTRIEVHTRDELGQLAADFNNMAKTLDTYETMRKQWMVDISHELRTPLSILRGEIEAIQDGVRTASMDRMESLKSEIIYLESIINDLHLLSLADTGSLTMTHEPVSPVGVLKTVLTLFETRLSQESLGLEVGLSHDNLSISGDRDRLKRLFSNIIENNLKYTRKPGTIRLWDRLQDQMLTIHIEDSGPGVPPSCVDKLFDRLYRVDRSRAREHGGSGLGLSICKTIVTGHNGTITALNAKNGGLQIRIQFPVI